MAVSKWSPAPFLNNCGIFIAEQIAIKVFGVRKLHKLFASLTITYTPKLGAPVVIKLYREIECGGIKVIVFPRGMLRDFADLRVPIEISFGAVGKIVVGAPISKLYDYQQKIANKLMTDIYNDANVARGLGCCLLSMDGGLGKTRIAAELIRQIRGRVLYITITKFLVSQAIDDICGYLGKIDCKKVSRKQVEMALKGTCALPAISVCIINTATKLDFNCFNLFDFVIIDEIHRDCAPTFQQIFWRCHRPYMLGMSATLNERKDGFDKLVVHHLGPIIHATDICPDAHQNSGDFNCSVQIIKYYGTDPFVVNIVNPKTKLISTSLMYKQFASDPDRVKLAVDKIVELYNWSAGELLHTIYVIGEEVAHLKAVMIETGKQLGEEHIRDLTTFMGKSTADEIERAVSSARVLFATYGYASTGVSIQRTSALIMYTPRRSNMKQIIARILRKGSDTRVPRVIVDIVDARTALQWQLRDRLKAYSFYGFQTQTNAHHATKNVITDDDEPLRPPDDVIIDDEEVIEESIEEPINL